MPTISTLSPMRAYSAFATPRMVAFRPGQSPPEIVGIANGYSGLINGDYREMNEDDFRGILTLGGTILGTKQMCIRDSL